MSCRLIKGPLDHTFFNRLELLKQVSDDLFEFLFYWINMFYIVLNYL